MEVWFYHLVGSPLEAALPQLVEKSLERNWRVIVQPSTPERVAELDALLWTYDEGSFVPHGTPADGDPSSQPVLLMTEPGNPNGAAIRFLVEGAPLPDDLEGYQRVALIFDGNDPDAVSDARAACRGVKARGLEAAYWQQGERGRWERKG